jgi:HEAT repeat protein
MRRRALMYSQSVSFSALRRLTFSAPGRLTFSAPRRGIFTLSQRLVMTALVMAVIASAAPARLGALAAARRDAGAAPTTRALLEARLQKATPSLSSAELAELGAAAGPLLIQIADDRAATTILRARAIAALAYVRTPAAHNYLENFVIRKRPSSEAADRALLRKAAVALGWQSGPRCVEVLATLLDHPDAEVRIDAVVALGLTRTRAADKPLRDRLPLESDPAVRAQIENQLKIIDDAAARSKATTDRTAN